MNIRTMHIMKDDGRIPQTKPEAYAFINHARGRYMNNIANSKTIASSDLDALRILADALTAIQTNANGVVV